MSYELEISPEFKARIKTGMKWLSLFLLAVAMAALGYFVTPRNVEGKPLLLTLRLMQIAAYQREVHAWTDTLKEVSEGLDEILAGHSTDLFAQDNRVNQLHGRLLNLRAEVEGMDVPPTLENLHALIGETVDAYILATTQTTAWVGEPTDANSASAAEALVQADARLERIFQNPWVLP